MFRVGCVVSAVVWEGFGMTGEYEAVVWAGYVASEQIRLLIAPIIERTRDVVGTHSPSCHEYHVACLAARIEELIGDRA